MCPWMVADSSPDDQLKHPDGLAFVETVPVADNGVVALIYRVMVTTTSTHEVD